MDFSAESLKQGVKNQEATAETPDSFSTIDGASQPRMSGSLDKRNTRMAGQLGSFALQLMNDPNALAVKDGWMSKFGLSNQGAEWNQAKMNQGLPPQQ